MWIVTETNHRDYEDNDKDWTFAINKNPNLHSPPCLQGLFAHSFMSSSHDLPLKQDMQKAIINIG